MSKQITSLQIFCTHFWIRFVAIVCLLALLLALGWAGTRQDSSGNTIENDLICPAGGGSMADSAGNTIDCAAGQTCVGVSQSSGGSELIHGVYYPEEQVIPESSTGYLAY